MQQPLVSVARRFLLFSGLCSPLIACAAKNTPAELTQAALQMENGIIEGEPSSAQDYPATGVILFVTERYDGSKFGSMMCSATLIRPDVIVSAGHCDLSLFVDTDAPISYYFSRSLDVTEFGRDSVDLPPLTTKIVKIVPHPQFNLHKVKAGLRRANDISLMYLEHAITDVVPATPIKRRELNYLEEGSKVAIVGYGRRHNEERDDMDAGIKYQGTTIVNRLGDYEMQIGPGSPQPHKCHGDSGGPTYLSFGRGEGRRTVLVGITSHAYDDDDCLHGGVDTRLDRYLKWMRLTLDAACDDGSRPACPEGDVFLDDAAPLESLQTIR